MFPIVGERFPFVWQPIGTSPIAVQTRCVMSVTDFTLRESSFIVGVCNEHRMRSAMLAAVFTGQQFLPIKSGTNKEED